MERTKQVFLKAGHHAYEVGLPVVRVRVMDPSRFRWRSHYKIRFACLLDISDCGKFVKIGPSYMSADHDHHTLGWPYRMRRRIKWVPFDWLEVQAEITIPKTSGIPTPN